ncbi:MAG: glycosyltransferase family 39 protein [Desulfovibrio sp.]|nr:glycosyltransferase family 39 protein [Desulfovibrio sp.]MBI4960273.1 glycosyltransferase family 39 protein [Desulfovibrio sp.]
MRSYITIFIVLILAATLRIAGITWGLPSPEMPLILHPDENRTIGALATVNIAKGELTPILGHMDGMLAYYLWTGALGAAKAVGLIDVYAYQASTNGEQYSKMVLVSRLLVVAFDLASIALVYATLRRLRVRPIFASLGAAVLAVVPIEVVYSHYMRPHIISNFFVTLTFFVTAVMLQSLRMRWRALAGLVCGLATATMYPAILTMIIPLSAITYEELIQKRKSTLFSNVAVGAIFNRNLVAFFIAFFVGFFVADPMLFLDIHTALGPLSIQWREAANLQQTSSGILFQLNKILSYIVTLIPRGAGPYLWILLYFSFLMAFTFKRRLAITVALNIFVLCVLFLMGAFYFHRAEFVRTIIMIFPPLAVLTSLSMDNFWGKLKTLRTKIVFVGILSFFLGSSLLFDIAYVRGMAAPDPRYQLLRYVRTKSLDTQLRIGLVISSWMSEYIAEPLRVLEAEGKVVVTLIFPDTPKEVIERQDLLCLVGFMTGDTATNQTKLRQLEAEGRFRLDQSFRNQLSLGWLSFDDEDLPHDMAYPYPKIILLRSATPRMSQDG